MSYCFLSICVFSVLLFHIIVVCLVPEFHFNYLWCVMSHTVNLCKICSKKVQSFSHYLQCVNCQWKCHVKCMDMKVHDITYPDQWYCPPCVQSVFVYNHYDDNDCFHNAVIEGMLDCSFQYHEMNNKVFMPFEINEGSDTPFTEIDPDFHFYTNSCSIKHTKCDYFIEDTFVDKFTKSGSFDRNLSLFHLNVKSLPKLGGGRVTRFPFGPLNVFVYISHWAARVNSQNRPHFEGDYRNWWLTRALLDAIQMAASRSNMITYLCKIRTWYY